MGLCDFSDAGLLAKKVTHASKTYDGATAFDYGRLIVSHLFMKTEGLLERFA